MSRRDQAGAGPVDVLAVMDAVGRALSANAKPLLGTEAGVAAVAVYAKVNEARAAVAELVQRAETGERALRNFIERYCSDDHRAAWLAFADDLRAALSKFGGDAANLAAARNLMDDELAERIHGTVETAEEFLATYRAAHLAKYGEEFSAD